jgi:hypothetical protein
MTEAPQRDVGLPWHQALSYALTGERRDETADQTSPDLELLAHQLAAEPGSEALSAHATERLDQGEPWPHPVPPDLMAGLGYAQFAAALSELVRSLGLRPSTVPAVRNPTSERAESETAAPPSADLRRLLDEVPPHHGS